MLEVQLSSAHFKTLTRYAFIIRPRLAPQKWDYHDLVRRAQCTYLEREQSAAPADFHRRAQQYYTYTAQARPWDTLYHAFFVEPETAFAEWQARESDAAFHFAHEPWAALTELAAAPELHRHLTPAQRAEIAYRAGRRHYYCSEWGGAVMRLEEALQLYREIGSQLGEANVLQAIGDVQQFQDDRDAALESYAAALRLFQAIGDVQQFQNDRDAALESYALRRRPPPLPGHRRPSGRRQRKVMRWPRKVLYWRPPGVDGDRVAHFIEAPPPVGRYRLR